MKNNKKDIKKASLVILKKENKILLIKRHNTKFANNMYTLPSGKVNNNETFLDAAIRETKEEVNASIKKEDIKSCLIIFENKENEDSEWIHHFFITNNWTGIINNMEPDKCNDVSWFDINNLPNNTITFVKDAIKYIINNKEHYYEIK